MTTGLFGVVFDLDGTLYLGDALIPGADTTLAWLRDRGARVRFVTNNPRQSRAGYAKKLSHLGISAAEDEVVTSATVMVDYLISESEPKWAPYFLLGEAQLRHELEVAGFPVTDGDDGGSVIVSFDTTLTYRKWTLAFRALRRGAKFLATNPDVYCPTPDGGLPDAGMLVAGLEIGTGRVCDMVVGKPSQFLANHLQRSLDLPAERLFMVGDRPETDMVLARRMGAHPVLVQTGVPKNGPATDALWIPSVRDLPDALVNLVVGYH